MQGNRLLVAGRRRAKALRLIPRLLALMGVPLCTLSPHASGNTKMQDLINEACAPSHYPLLPPCEKEITLDELNSRLHYKLEMIKAEDEQMKIAWSSWERDLGLLYVEPTQRVWDLNKHTAMILATDLIRERLSKTINAQGVLFLTNAHGDPDVVRKHILWYLISNNVLGQRGRRNVASDQNRSKTSLPSRAAVTTGRPLS